MKAELLKKMPSALLEMVKARLAEIKKPSLDDIMQAVILEMALLPESRTETVTAWLSGYKEAARYAWYCDDMIMRLREARKQYGEGQEALDTLLADVAEFRIIYDLADEIPSISGGWLSLNQGLPSNKAELVLKLRYMACIVSDRERRLGIKGDAMFTGIFTDFILKATVKRLWELHPEYDEEYVENTLQDAYDQGVMNNFDIVKCLTDKEYWNATREYLNLLKGTVNVLSLLEANENYMEILHALRTQLTIDGAMAAKSRFANQVVKDVRYLKREQVEDALKFSEKLFVLEFLQGLPPVTVALDDKSSAPGFDMFFRNITTADFDLGTAEGISGFRRFVETDFLGWLREKYPDNGLVRHLVLSDDRRGRVLKTDIDLRNPEVSRDSVIAYNDIMNGAALLGGKAYQQHSDGLVMMTRLYNYTVSDILQLYNLVVNNNRYGPTMLTTVFQDAADDPKSLLGKYFKFINERDSNMSDMEYDSIDYQISTAPTVSEYGLRYHSEPFVKMKDDVWGEVVMVNIGNGYQEYNMLKDIRDDEPVEERDARRAAFVRYCPFEMPVRFGISRDTRVLNYTGEPDIEALTHTLANLMRANKILVLKDCGAMGCRVILRVNGKNPETGRKAFTDFVLFEKEGNPVEQDTLLTMTDVAEYITRIEEKDRAVMADAVADSFALPVTYKTLNTSPIVGNATPESLLNEFNLQGISLDGVTRRYNILRCNKIKSGKQEITGRVINGSGQPMYVVTDLKSARMFLNYVLAQKQADESFGDDGDILEEAGLPGEMADDLRAVAKHFKKTPKDLYMAWLDNKGAFPSYNTGNTIVRPNVLMQRMSKWLMYGRWTSTLTDFEQELYGIGKVNRNFQWRIPRDKLYETLVTNFPDEMKDITYKAFMSMTAEELNALCVTGRNPLFFGNSRLEQAEILTETPDEEEDLTEVYKTENLKTVWDQFYAAAKGHECPAEYKEFKKLSNEEKARIVNATGWSFTGNDGTVKTLTAKVTQAGRLQYRLAYRGVKKAPEVMLTFKYKLLNDIYQDFSYDTAYPYELIGEDESGGRVRNGMYRGFYVAKRAVASEDGRRHTVYTVSRHYITPYTMASSTYGTLEDALNNIDRRHTRDTIESHRLMEIKCRAADGTAPRTCTLDTSDIAEGGVVTTLDITLKHRDITGLRTLRKLYMLTVPEFQSLLSHVANIDQIDTPEKAAAFIDMIGSLIKENQEDTTDLLNELGTGGVYEQGVQEVIRTISSASRRHYHIDRLRTIYQKDDKGKVTSSRKLALITDLGTDADMAPEVTPFTRARDTVSVTLTDATDWIRNTIGVPVTTVTNSELEALFAENNVPYNPDKIYRAFILNGRIYFNTSKARMSDLFHELAHVVMGVMKTADMDSYMRFLESLRYSRSYGYMFIKRLEQARLTYNGFADADIMEEAAVDVLAEILYSNKSVMSGAADNGIKTFDGEKVTDALLAGVKGIGEDLTAFLAKAINGMRQKLDGRPDNGLGVSPKLTTDLARLRRITNYVRKQIQDDVIREEIAMAKCVYYINNGKGITVNGVQKVQWKSYSELVQDLQNCDLGTVSDILFSMADKLAA